MQKHQYAKTFKALDDLTWVDKGDSLVSTAHFSANAANQAIGLFRSYNVDIDITSPSDHNAILASRCHLAIARKQADYFSYLTGVNFKIESPDRQLAREMGIDISVRSSRGR